jgi:hypothetical protein
MTAHKHSFTTALFFTLALFGLQTWTNQPPEVRGPNTPADEFSATRAALILEKLLAENQPHPVGSALNRIIKQRIIDELESYGLSTSEQKTFACAARHLSCAWVENVIAIIPGKEETPYITLMAHYDSVPMAPGAGDDGAGVAAILETAKILAGSGPSRNPILVLITDAEEVGLIGAEAFFNQHPLADKTGVVLNYEGSGSTGVSQLLRTGRDNHSLVNAYGDVTGPVNGNSLANEIFKRMPNDTDFSVAMRAGKQGIDFAFAAERNHYHTPLDTIENLDLRTLQHHGENLLPLVRHLADMDLDSLETGDLNYANLLGMWLQWSAGTTWLLIILCVALLAYSTFHYRDQIRITSQLLAILAIPLTISFAVTAIALLSFKLISLYHGTLVSWPAHDWGYRLVLFFSPLVVGLPIATWSNRKLNFITALHGSWCFWLIMTTLLAIFLPAAVSVLMVPTFCGSLLLAATCVNPKPQFNSLLMAMAVGIAAIPSLGLVLPLETSQGYRLIAGTLPSLALFMVVLWPLVRGIGVRESFLMTGLLFATGMLAALSLPLYSTDRPQHVNIAYIHNNAENKAWISLVSADPLPEPMLALHAFEENPRLLYPGFSSNDRPTTGVTPANLKLPQLIIEDIQQGQEHREVYARFESRRQANFARLLIPSNPMIKRVLVDGFEIPLQDQDEDYYSLRLAGVPQSGFSLQMTIAGNQSAQVYAGDLTTELPEVANDLYNARSPFATPVHQGDLALVYTIIEI